MTKNKELWRVVKFVLFSARAGIIQIGSFTALSELTSWPYYACYLPSLLLSIIWNFTLNRKFTFKSSANIPSAMLKVVGYYCVFTPHNDHSRQLPRGVARLERLPRNGPQYAPQPLHRVPLPTLCGLPR